MCLTCQLVCYQGRDTLRCLALATIDNPMKKEDMDLEDATKFYKFEVRITLMIYTFFERSSFYINFAHI